MALMSTTTLRHQIPSRLRAWPQAQAGSLHGLVQQDGWLHVRHGARLIRPLRLRHANYDRLWDGLPQSGLLRLRPEGHRQIPPDDPRPAGILAAAPRRDQQDQPPGVYVIVDISEIDVGEYIRGCPLLLKGVECPLSKLVNSDACPRPTTGVLVLLPAVFQRWAPSTVCQLKEDTAPTGYRIEILEPYDPM